MPQFVTADRDHVQDFLAGMDFISETQACGPGVTVGLHEDSGPITGFTALMERKGWYVDQIDHARGQPVITVMPVPDHAGAEAGEGDT